jgi:hypothetical protein
MFSLLHNRRLKYLHFVHDSYRQFTFSTSYFVVLLKLSNATLRTATSWASSWSWTTLAFFFRHCKSTIFNFCFFSSKFSLLCQGFYPLNYKLKFFPEKLTHWLKSCEWTMHVETAIKSPCAKRGALYVCTWRKTFRIISDWLISS